MRNHRADSGIGRRQFIGTITGAAALALIGLDKKALAGGPHVPGIARDFNARICYNENPLGPSPAAAEAMIDVAYLSHRYPDWFGESLASELASIYGLSSSNFVCGSGATEILRLCALAFSTPGGNVIVPNPSYSQFPSDCEFLGHGVRYVSLDSNHRVSLQGIDNRIDNNTTAICITNPNNPTGTIISHSSLASFVQALDPDITVIIDEAYLEYIDDENYVSAVELVRQGRNVVIVKTFSKVYGLAGARIGYAIASPGNIQEMHRWQFATTISRPCLEAAKASLSDQAHVDQTVTLARDMKEYCFQSFAQMGLTYIPSEASFFMVDVNTDADYVCALLAEREILVRTGWGMGQHLRVSTGLAGEMERFIYELSNIINNLPPGGGPANLSTTELFQASPNPFNSSTVIRIHLPRGAHVRLEIFDIQGRLVNYLADSHLGPGEHAYTWNGTGFDSKSLASGNYFYRLTSGDNVITRKMLMLK
jgi:histidinol-phosphate aminotransferase